MEHQKTINNKFLSNLGSWGWGPRLLRNLFFKCFFVFSSLFWFCGFGSFVFCLFSLGFFGSEVMWPSWLANLFFFGFLEGLWFWGCSYLESSISEGIPTYNPPSRRGFLPRTLFRKRNSCLEPSFLKGIIVQTPLF